MRLLDFLQLFLLASLWGASFLFMRIAAPEFGAIWLIELRVLIAGLIFLPFALGPRYRSQFLDNILPFFIAGLLNAALPFSLFAYASITMTAGYTSILNATVPLFGMLIAAVFLRERFTYIRIVGFIIGFVGVVVLTGLSTSMDTPGFALATAAGLIASISYATVTPYIKLKFADIHPMVTTAGTMLSAAIILIPLLPFTAPTKVPSLPAFASLIALGAFSTALAFILFFNLIKRIGSTRTLTVAYLIPVFAIVFGALALGELITVTTMIGGALVLLGTAIANNIVRALNRN